MSTEALTPPPAEALPEKSEQLFPIGLDQILPIRNRLLTLNSEDLWSFVEVRRDGRSNDPVTIMYGSGFAAWHQERGDFGDETSAQELRMYRAGKLYGAQIALDRYRELHGGQPLRADDPIAYAAAQHRVLHSYEDVGDVTQWERDYQREQRHMHGNMLALLNAGLHDHTLRMYSQMYGGEIPKDESLESFYTGLVDAGIFINTYASMRDTNERPAPAVVTDREWGHDLPDIYHLAQMAIDRMYGNRIVIELESTDADFSDLVAAMRVNDQYSTRVMFPGMDGRTSYVAAFTRVIEQTGPNEFVYINEPRGIYEINQVPARTTKAYRAKWAGCYALVGAFVGNVPDAWMHTSPAQAVAAGGLCAVIGAAAGLAKQKPSTDNELSLVWVAPGYEPDSQNLGFTLQK